MNKKKIRTLLVYCLTILAILLMGISATLAVLKDVNNKDDNDLKFGKVAIKSELEDGSGSSLSIKLDNNMVTNNSVIFDTTNGVSEYQKDLYFVPDEQSEDMFVRLKIFYSFDDENLDMKFAHILNILNGSEPAPLGLEMAKGDDYEYIAYNGWYYLVQLDAENAIQNSQDRLLQGIASDAGKIMISNKYILKYPIVNEPEILAVVKARENGIHLKVQVEAIQCEGLGNSLSEALQQSNGTLISNAVGLGSKYNVTIGEYEEALGLHKEEYIKSELQKIKFDRSFINNTPATMSEISGIISKYNMTEEQIERLIGWKIGDERGILLESKDSQKIVVRIIGFNHDDLSGGNGKAGITLQMTHCLNMTYQMNEVDSNVGGYAKSQIKTKILPEFKSYLPKEWRNIIKLVDKKSADGGDTSYTKTITLKEDLFLLSEYEVFGSTIYGKESQLEGTQYKWYEGKTNADRTMKIGFDATSWWLRSCREVNTRVFCIVYSEGYASGDSASKYNGVSFAFCI